MYASLMRLATSAKSKGLSDFVVEGEKRYWLHPPHPPSVAAATYGVAGPLTSSYGEAGIAIDCFDGTVVGQQLEEVTEIPRGAG